MRKAAPAFFAIVAGLCIIIGLALDCVALQCFDRSFYKDEYARLHTAASIGVTQEELSAATEVLLDYTEGKRDDLNVTANIGGQERQVFNEREKRHMEDVRALYLGAVTVANILLAAGAVYMAALFFAKRGSIALRGYIRANIAFAILFGALALYAAVDFNAFWTGFHHVFFTNDLWLLDPATDILIQMVPGQFFFDLVMRIVLLAVGAWAVLLAAAIVLLRRRKRANNG